MSLPDFLTVTTHRVARPSLLHVVPVVVSAVIPPCLITLAIHLGVATALAKLFLHVLEYLASYLQPFLSLHKGRLEALDIALASFA